VSRETRVDFLHRSTTTMSFLLDRFCEARERAPTYPRRSRALASRDRRSPSIIALESNRDFVVEFAALRAS